MNSVTSEVRIRSINTEQMKLLERNIKNLVKKRNFWISEYRQTGEGFPFEVLFEFEYDNGENPWQVIRSIKALFLWIAELIIDGREVIELDLIEYNSLVGGIRNEN